MAAGRVVSARVRQLRGDGRPGVVSLDENVTIEVDLHTGHGRHLFVWGFCEPAARVMQSLLRPGGVVIDGGANIGLYTLLAAAAVGPSGRVIACEPAPGTIEMLRASIRRNGFDWVDLRESALADAPGRLSIRVFEPGSGSSSFAPADQTTGTEIEVEVTTLDEVAGPHLEQTNLVKLDVEGAELLALRGAQRLLTQARPDFIIELEPDHLARQGSSVADVQTLFADVDYVGFAIVDGALQPLQGAWSRPSGDPNIVVRPRERSAV
ncbi:MAG TPA: FkbM family methyltransferase [Solirubrobacteraceae bacterium]|nr:FkbM family methyltransferase [Solirubrobacteraceae bacterium]